MHRVCMFWGRYVTLNFTDYQKWLRIYFFFSLFTFVVGGVFLCLFLNQFSVICSVVITIMIIIIINIIVIIVFIMIAIIYCFGKGGNSV